MVKPAYLFFAFLALLIFIAILVAFVALPDNGGPFDRGDTPSLVTPGAPGVETPDEYGLRGPLDHARARHRRRPRSGAAGEAVARAARSRVARR